MALRTYIYIYKAIKSQVSLICHLCVWVAAMGIMKKWWNLESAAGRGSESIQLGSNAHPAKWQTFWKKIKRDKKKRFPSTSQVTSYDPKTYSNNFDHGTSWMEPDNLSRSFSARFAVPSNLVRINTSLLD
jgi:hypothetical protein